MKGLSPGSQGGQGTRLDTLLRSLQDRIRALENRTRAHGILKSVVSGSGVNVDDTDPANPVISAIVGGVVESVVPGPGVNVDDTDPANPIVSATGGGTVDSVVPGPGINVDDTDPANPIVSTAPPPTYVNKCVDSDPVIASSWYGGDPGLILDSTYPGLHVTKNPAYFSSLYQFDLPGDSFTVDPAQSYFGTAAKTFLVLGDLSVEFNFRADSEPQTIVPNCRAYDAAGTYLGFFALDPVANNVVPPFAAIRSKWRLDYAALSATYPTLHSVWISFIYTSPVTGGNPTFGSSMVIDTTGLPADWEDSTSWFELTEVPASFPSTIPEVAGLQAVLDTKIESIEAGPGISVDATDPQHPVVSATPAPSTTMFVPLTTVIGGVPEFVWDSNNELVYTEVPI